MDAFRCSFVLSLSIIVAFPPPLHHRQGFILWGSTGFFHCGIRTGAVGAWKSSESSLLLLIVTAAGSYTQTNLGVMHLGVSGGCSFLHVITTLMKCHKTKAGELEAVSGRGGW